MESWQTAVCLFSQSVSKVCCFVKREVTSSLWLGNKALSNDHVLAVRLDKKFKNRADAFCSWASGVRRSASWFFSRDEGMMNAGFALNLVTGKGSNAWVLNGIYLKMLITTYINHAFFFLLLKPLSYILCHLRLLHFLPYIQRALLLSGLRHCYN